MEPFYFYFIFLIPIVYPTHLALDSISRTILNRNNKNGFERKGCQLPPPIEYDVICGLFINIFHYVDEIVSISTVWVAFVLCGYLTLSSAF